jgi:hypothetical protein
MATNASFNLSKPVKRIAATILDKEVRRLFLNAMIDAEYTKLNGKGRKWSDPATAQRAPRGNATPATE